MANYMGLNVTQQDLKLINKEINRLVKNFNAKIDYQSKVHPERARYQPEKIKVSEVKARITSPVSLRRETTNIKTYLKKGSEETVTNKHGVTTTRYKKEKAVRLTKQYNRQVRKAEKKAGRSTKTGSMGADVPKEKHFDFNAKTSQKEFDMFVEALEYNLSDKYITEKQRTFKNNYLNAIGKELGNGPNATKLYNLIGNMDPDKVFKGYNEDVDAEGYRRDFLSIEYTYNQEDAESAAESIYDNWMLIRDSL